MKRNKLPLSALFAGAAIFGYSGQSQADLVAYWTFDETTGIVAADTSGSTLVHDATWQTTGAGLTWSPANGIIGGAASMGGNNNSYEFTTTPSSLDGTTSWSAGGWFNRDSSVGGYKGLLTADAGMEVTTIDANTTNSYNGINSGAEKQIDCRINNNNNGTVSGELLDDTWHHVLYTYDGTTRTHRMWVDGVETTPGGTVKNVTGIVTSGLWHIGRDRTQNGRCFGGKMDDWAIWDEALAPAMAPVLYDRGITAGLPAVVAGDFDVDGISDADELSGALNPFGAAPTDPKNPDSDGDGILDGEEIVAGADTFVTNPNSDDTDSDLLLDGWEVDNSLDPTDDGSTDPNNGATGDPDGDLLDNLDEQDNPEYPGVSTDPNVADTDNDGLSDNDETLGLLNIEFYEDPTDPTDPDSDDDGLTDNEEITGSLNSWSLGTLGTPPGDPTDPNFDDTDNDTLLDKQEIDNLLDPNDDTGDNNEIGDPDGDNLDNYDEINTYNTDPQVADTDEDGLDDGEEVQIYFTDPLIADTDGDTLEDGEEIDGTLNPYSGGVLGTAPGDPTEPTLADSDEDGIDDGEEIVAGTDGYVTDPNNADTDGDQFNDSTEIAAGTSPVDANDAPNYWQHCIGYWPLDRATGITDPNKITTAGDDDAVFAQTAGNGLTWTLGGPYGSGDAIGGYAATNDSNPSYFVITELPGLVSTAPKFTIMGWVKRNASGYRGIFFSRDVDDAAGTNRNYGLALDTTHIEGRFSNPGLDPVSPAGEIPLSTWSHVAMTYDGTTGKVFLDGQEAGSGAYTITDITRAGKFLFGADPQYTTREFNGGLDDFAVFATDLPGGMLNEVYQAGLNGEPLTTSFPNAPAELSNIDSDGDEICDQWEMDLYGSLDGDIDADTLEDAYEEFILGTDPYKQDSEDDGLLDPDEIAGTSGYVTDPTLRDSDMDGVADGTEIADGTDPTDPLDFTLPTVTGQLLTYYNFDEDTGTIAADSALDNGAQDLTQIAGGVAWTTGLIGGSIDMTSDVMTGISPIPDGASAFTISGWVNETAGQGGYRGIYTTGASGQNWGLNVENSRNFDMRVANDGGGSQGLDMPGATQSTWHHIAMTWTSDGSLATAKAYLDGVLVVTKTEADGIALSYTAGAQTWYLGRDRTTDSRRFTGLIDDLSVFANVMSDEDIGIIADAGFAGIPVTAVLEPAAGTLDVLSVVVVGTDVTITWDSSGGAPAYTVLSTTDLSLPYTSWTVEEAALPTGGATTSYTDTDTITSDTKKFYVIVEN